MPSDEPLPDRCGATCKQGGYCTQYPVTDAERCRMHGGTGSGAPKNNQNAVGNSGGAAPPNNTNGEKHGLRARRQKLTARLDEAELAFIDEITQGYLDAAPFDEDHVFALHVHELAIDAYKRHRANLYILDEGLTQEQVVGVDESGRPISREDENVVHQAYSRFTRDLRTELKDLGIMGGAADSPIVTLRDVFISLQENTDDFEIDAETDTARDADSTSKTDAEVINSSQ
jgi:hypothetical protein